MSKKLFSQSLLRYISDVACEIRTLTRPHRPPSPKIHAISPLHLPDVRAPVQFFIDMGIRPALARRLSGIYMDIASQYRQIFESYFRRAIQDSNHLHPGHYRNIFVVQFKGTIRALGFRIMSIAWVWLCQAGLSPILFCPQRIDVHMDASTKAQILSIFPDFKWPHMNQRVNTIELPDEGCKTDSSTKMMLTSARPPFKSTAPSTHDFFSSEKPSTCFPECYPPPLSKPIFVSQKALVTRFFRTTSAKSEKSCNVDMSLLTTLFGRMSVTASEVALKAQKDSKCSWVPRSKKPEPLPPLLSPIAAGVSGPPQKLQAPNTGVVSSDKSNTAPRRRRIATLPTRQTKTTALPSLDLSSHSVTNPLVLAPASDNSMRRTPPSRFEHMIATGETFIESAVSSSATVQHRPPSQPRHTTGTPDILGSKADFPGQRKRLPLPRRVASKLQTTTSQRQTQATPSGRRTPLSSTLHTPPLVSDTSPSVSDSFSSSDESDTPRTPPSTPSEHSYSLTAQDTLTTSFVFSSKANTTGSFCRPMATNTESPGPGKREGIHIDFTSGDAAGERQLHFTFGV